MRVVHVTDFYLPRTGGIERQVAGTAARQAAAGHSVTVLTTTRAGDERSVDDGGAVAIRRARPDRIGRPDPEVVRSALLDADVVQVHLGGVSPLGWSVLRSRGAAGLPTVVTVHSLLDGLGGVYRPLAALGGWRHLPIVWCGVGGTVGRQLRSLLGAAAAVQVLPNAVDGATWIAPPGPGVLAPAELLVVSALRHTRRKRVEALPGVLARAQRLLTAGAAGSGVAAPRLRAVIAGEGHRTPALHAGLRRAGIDDWVSTPGVLDTVALSKLYHGAHVYLAPTVLESFGLAALEARAAGLPVIAHSRSGSAEVLEHDREGLLVDSDEAMAGALAHLALDPVRRLAIAEHNRTTPIRYDWPSHLALTEHAWSVAADLCAGRTGGTPGDDLTTVRAAARG
ncbi:glycosyltransferase family 4 protein [Cellulomonas sp. McL0617]|uniref:glycosyltransferase family 4 protein n=1 Tax=Cellulomonas sp. McL0617 TaxID=3415675 RepID=UPI003CF641F2